MEVYNSFEVEQFGSELVTLLRAWEGEWSYQGSGPSPDPSSGEKRSYQAVLDYIGTTLTVASQYEESELVLKALRRYWGDFAGGSQSDPLYIRVLHDAFARTLQITRRQVNTGKDRDVQGLMIGQRKQLQRTLGFGYLKVELETE